MVSIKTKKMRGKEYRYASKSIRLPDGGVKTAEVILKDGITPEIEKKLIEKEKNLRVRWALSNQRFYPPVTKDDIRKMEEIRIGYRHVMGKLGKKDLEDLWNRFIANFTFDSNAIEGNSLTLKDVTMLLFDKELPEGKDLREVYETRNSRKALDMILDRKFRVNEKDVVRLHKILVRDIDDRLGYKNLPNILVGRKVKTTLPEDVKKDMDELFEFYHKNRGKLNPILLASEFHGRFEGIHPFSDGNGRVGRFLILIQLIDQGYPPLIIRSSQKRAYFKCLEDFDGGYKDNLARFILRQYKRTFGNFFEEYLKYL